MVKLGARHDARGVKDVVSAATYNCPVVLLVSFAALSITSSSGNIMVVVSSEFRRC
jgi:hypothetical protein